MGEVVNLFTDDQAAEQIAIGPAFCLGCDATWIAHVPVGEPTFECPGCRRWTGRFKFEFAPSEGQMVRTCHCDNQLFYLTPEGHLCASCGIYQRY